MKKEMKISVVIPTYRRPELLMECIHALARQHFDRGDFEVLVVSDGPDAATKKVVSSWKATGLLQLKYLCLQHKGGPAAARNKGWKNAAGKIIAFTDDDCRPDPEWLNRIWQHHRQDEDLVAYTGKVVVPMPEPGEITDHAYNTAHLSEAEFITANCACTKRALELTGGFDERFTMAWREDSDLEFNFLRHGIPIRYLPVARVVHPVRKSSWGSSLWDQRKGIFNALLFRKYPSLYKTRIKQAPPLKYYIMAGSLVAFMICLLLGNLPAAALLLGCWIVTWLYFTGQRLLNTSRQPSHMLEMLYTSAFIPLLSIYWHFYGSIKYRAFFL
ncbi:glycosyltransferase family 2 protein [Chitinophaga sp. RCC_12]|uniref:glycosyltransferase n=1 Tax=Chitinophaga sp. RCC_12 TaxID=3239226 RepID=UPI003525396F